MVGSFAVSVSPRTWPALYSEHLTIRRRENGTGSADEVEQRYAFSRLWWGRSFFR